MQVRAWLPPPQSDPSANSCGSGPHLTHLDAVAAFLAAGNGSGKGPGTTREQSPDRGSNIT